MLLEATAMSLTSTDFPGQQDPLGTVVSEDPFNILPQDTFLASEDSLSTAPQASRLIIRSPWFERSLVLDHRQEWVIGRDKKSHIVLPDRSISRHHAILKYVTSQGFILEDQGSLNGCYVNNQRVTQSVLLKSGDRLKLGKINLDFQCRNPEDQNNSISLYPKNVLITSSSPLQGEIWREILSSQGLSTTWANPGISLDQLLEILAQLGQSPSLLLLDLGGSKNNPYEFCRRCQQNQPDLPIILTSGMRTELYPSEHQWAVQQGALDLFPGFKTNRLLSQIGEIAVRIRTILQALKWEAIAESSLASTLLELQEKINTAAP
jgi:CheY-like chemotaxis protein